MAFTVAACSVFIGGAGQALSGPNNNTLNAAVAADPVTLDPSAGLSGAEYVFLYALYDRLVHFEPSTLRPLPGLATDWKFTGQGNLDFEMNIRQGVKFHDGTELNAEAVKTSLDHVIETGIVKDLSPVKSIEVTGPYKIVIHLSRPYSILPMVLADRAGMIISPAALKKYGKDIVRNPVGTGPFKLDEWQAGSHLKVSRFADYWDKNRIHLNAINFVVIPNDTATTSALITGQVDVASADVKAFPVLKSRPNLRVEMQPSTAYSQISLNVGKPPVNDLAVRKAISLAIDRQAVADAMLMPATKGVKAIQPIWPSHPFYNPDVEKSIEYNPEKAKKILADAGYKGPIDLPICARSNTAMMGTDITDILIEQLRKVNINLKVTVMDPSACIQAYITRKEFPSLMDAFSGRPHPYMTFEQNAGSNGTYNYSKYAFPGLDDVLNKIADTYDEEAQKALWFKAQDIWADQLPEIVLFYRPYMYVYGNGAKGEEPNLMGKPDYTMMRFN
jgi:peptide/nickel transport system permease protein/peptide/nickel transport system substrate-binding protein